MESSSNMGRVLVIADEVNAPLFRSVGLTVYEARDQKQVVETVDFAMKSLHDVSLIIVLKHLVEDEDSLRKSLEKYGVTLLILPTRWAKAEPINVDKLLAKALGLG
ncbi:MAG: hypothetical protein F7C82_01990 [Desulfurococcales archaeon]|nr:hypothetical protein [Desulfurococcales archaeon]MCE4629031.1 hypothetical protein [Desulfurococcales archaeon]